MSNQRGPFDEKLSDEMRRGWTVRTGKHLVIAMIAMLALSGELGSSAYAWHHHHRLPKQQKMHYKPDQNSYLFGGKHTAPKKQRPPKGSYRNPVTGGIVYGKP